MRDRLGNGSKAFYWTRIKHGNFVSWDLWAMNQSGMLVNMCHAELLPIDNRKFVARKLWRRLKEIRNAKRLA